MKRLYSLALEQKENTKHGETFFPVQKYSTRLSSDYPVVTTHWHEEAELTLITEGTCLYQIDLTDYQVACGDILFIPPLFLHSISVGDGETLRSETYVFHMHFLGSNSTDICSTRYLTPMMNQEFSMPFLITPGHPAYGTLRTILSQIMLLYEEAPVGYELALKSLLLQVIFHLLPYSQRDTSANTRASSQKLKAVLDYMELHYALPLSIAELAKLCYFSEYHFMRLFKKHMNMTCVEYLNNLRLEKAVELFEQGNPSALDVSLSVGFRNLSYFHRAFKKKYHMTPLSFIRELKKE